MTARVAAVAFALTLIVPAAGLSAENPWTTIRQLFREPVAELKKQFERIPPPVKAAPAAKPGAQNSTAAAAPPSAEPGATPVPRPVARPTIMPVDQSASGGGADAPVAQSDLSDGKPAADGQPMAESVPAPIPRPRPDLGIAYAAVDRPSPANDSTAAIGALVGPSRLLVEPPPAARSTCGIALARLGVKAAAIAPISEGACGVAEPVAVAALGGGDIDLTTKAIVDCQLAEAFAGWLDGEVQPAARKFLNGEVVGLRIVASYTCRSRNGVEGAKLSEHGRGNAIDISALNVAGRGWIEVGGDHANDEAKFLATIRAAACGPFTTVLGPGTDASHSDHFHFDLAKRRKRGKGRGLYCR